MQIKCLCFIVFLIYFWLTTQGTNDIKFLTESYSGRVPYNLLLQSFINGKLSLNIKPDPRLFKLSNPYDSNLNSKYKYFDASLYKNKYYSCFGVVPVIVLYFPYWFLTNLFLPDSLANLIFIFGGFLWSKSLITYLWEKYFNKSSKYVLLTIIIVLGFATIGGYLLQKPSVHHIAIAGGYFFSTGALYFLCRAFSNIYPSLTMLFLASLFIGLAIGCRPNHIFLSLSIFISLLKIIKTNDIKYRKNFSKLKLILALLCPFLSCLTLLGMYNYLRFNDFFEFGYTYQLSGAPDMKVLFNGDFLTFLDNLYILFLEKPIIDTNFPFAHIVRNFPPFLKRPNIYYPSAHAGIIPTIPFILILLTWFVIKYLKINHNDLFEKKIQFPKFEFIIIFLPAIIYIIQLLRMRYIAYRYLSDFITLLLIPSGIVWLYYDSILRLKIKKKLRFIAYILSTISIFYGLAFGIGGFDNNIEKVNPLGFNKIKSFFDFFTPVASIIGIIMNYFYSNFIEVFFKGKQT